MNTFFLEKLRKIYKSLGKKEKKINQISRIKNKNYRNVVYH